MSEDPALRGLIDGTLNGMMASAEAAGLHPTDLPFAAMKVAAAAFAMVIPSEADAQGVKLLQRQFQETVAHLRKQSIGPRG